MELGLNCIGRQVSSYIKILTSISDNRPPRSSTVLKGIVIVRLRPVQLTTARFNSSHRGWAVNDENDDEGYLHVDQGQAFFASETAPISVQCNIKKYLTSSGWLK